MRLAIAEPDAAAADLLMFVAQRRGHQPISVSSLSRLFERMPFEPAAAIVSVARVDDETLEQIAKLGATFPGICTFVICEKPGASDALAVLRAGAADCIASPYNPFEVLVRIEGRMASREAPRSATGGIRLADLHVDLEAYSATKNGHTLSLTKLERRLLYCLCEHHPNLATIDRLLVFGWDSIDDPDAGLLKTHMSHIRRKLRDAGGAPFEIVSHQTVGYAMRLAQAAQCAS